MAQAEMMKLTEIKIQESPALTGANRQKGITKEDLSSKRVTFSDQVHAAVSAKISDALAGIMSQVADWAGQYGANADQIVAAMRNNIDTFRLDAGGGYTNVHKAYLLENGTVSGVEVLAEDFICPDKRGGVSKATGTPASIPTGSLSLD